MENKLNTITYNNVNYPVSIKKINMHMFEASITVHGATAVGPSEHEAISNLKNKLEPLLRDSRSNIGKDKLLLD